MNRELAVGLAVSFLIATGTFAAGAFLTAAEDQAIELAPADTFFYANAFLNPATSQKQAIRDLLKKFPRAGTPDEAEAELDRLLDEAFQAEGVSWSTEVKPWLGDQVAAFFTAPQFAAGAPQDPPGAALIETENEDASWAFIEKLLTDRDVQDRSYQGVDYSYDILGDEAWGIVDGFVVTGNEGGFKAAVDAERGESLADSDRFENALEPLEDDYLALMYFDVRPMFESIERSGQVPPGMLSGNALFGGQEPVAAVAYARDDGLVMDATGSGVGLGTTADIGSGLLEDLPPDSWLGIGADDVGGSLQRVFDSLDSIGVPGMATGLITQQIQAATGLDLERDVFSWMGDLGGFVTGVTPSEVEGGLVLEVKNRPAAAGALLRLQKFLKQQGAPIRMDATPFLGFAIQDFSMPKPINVALSERRLVVAYGDEATARGMGAPTGLGRRPNFQAAQRALGTGFESGVYVDVQSVIELIKSGIEPTMSEEDRRLFEQDIMPNLAPLKFLVIGSKVDGGRPLQRIVIGVR